jgi:rhomboid family GlyGly-CTERM serine protease
VNRVAALSASAHLWLALCAALGLGALLGWLAPALLLDWQPELAAGEPWRWWTAAFVHWSPGHLGSNLVGLLLVAALGHVAALPRRAAAAWLLAWPITHLGLLMQPALAHYGGLSGVLHAGAAVAGCWLLATARGRPRLLGAVLLTGLAIKILLEEPWGPPLVQRAGWEIALAPAAHATGALAGVACAALLLGMPRRQSAA